jgi:hypothetical protein
VTSLLPNDVYYQCSLCATHYEVELGRISCDCGGVLDLHFDAPAWPTSFEGRGVGLSRYREVLPIEEEWLSRADLGASRTPMLSVGSINVKCDYISPSGSFKDRGAFMLAALAIGLGATSVIVDSSGNAGAAMAAYCARIGVPCTVVAPASAPQGKLAQSRAYGATVVAVEGPRAAATDAALEMAADGGFYASHVENPFFTEGTKTWAFEVFEQLGEAPAEVVMSVGNGSLFLGVDFATSSTRASRHACRAWSQCRRWVGLRSPTTSRRIAARRSPTVSRSSHLVGSLRSFVPSRSPGVKPVPWEMTRSSPRPSGSRMQGSGSSPLQRRPSRARRALWATTVPSS